MTSTTTNLKASELADIFNARIRTWQDGKPITWSCAIPLRKMRN